MATLVNATSSLAAILLCTASSLQQGRQDFLHLSKLASALSLRFSSSVPLLCMRCSCSVLASQQVNTPCSQHELQAPEDNSLEQSSSFQLCPVIPPQPLTPANRVLTRVQLSTGPLLCCWLESTLIPSPGLLLLSVHLSSPNLCLSAQLTLQTPVVRWL